MLSALESGHQRGKRTTVVATAVAREMAAFLWAIAQVVAPKEAAS